MTDTTDPCLYHKAGEHEFETVYKLGRVLGQGSFAKVYLAQNKIENNKWAIKAINRSTLNASDTESLELEIEVLRKVHHRNIVYTKEIYDSTSHCYIVMECMKGGELFDRIVEKEHFSEKEAKHAMVEIVCAIKYCHDQGIVHRDLKPENILYDSNKEDAVLKLADFGLADLMREDVALTAACGTPTYIAPEILSNKGKGYGAAVDMWSIGVILYIINCGFPPFYADDDKHLFKAIRQGKFEYLSPYWDDASSELKDLIDKLLVVDPAQRYTADEVLGHAWLSEEYQHSTKHMASTIAQLKKYNARRRYKGAVRAVVAMSRLAASAAKEE